MTDKSEIRIPKSVIAMFCPKCGKADQSPETFCRQCGSFLPDFEKEAKKKTTPEDHILANAVLSLLTMAASLTLSILLFSIFLKRSDTHPVIYVTAGFLLTITAWQIQTFWRTMLLRKHFKKPKNHSAAPNESEASALKTKPVNQLLPEANLENHIPASVVERTTRKLKVK